MQSTLTHASLRKDRAPQEGPSLLPAVEFLSVVAKAPLIAIDLIVLNRAQHALLGLRRNAPAKNTWFVPGGRILKNEPRAAAFQRIAFTETGLAFDLQVADFIGIFEHFYEDNFASTAGIGTHYVTLAYLVHVIDHETLRPPQDQHSAYRWASIDEIRRSPDVHPYTKSYFADL
jgi:colanic acid biosynthesis protein WcaH